MLAGEQGLARVSPKPGFTKMINIFTINKNWRLVDLPGYGFATGSKKNSKRFNKAVANYLKLRVNLCFVFALIEAELEPQAIDLEFIEWLASNEVPFALVFTKTDKVKPAAVLANIATFKERIAPWFSQLPATFQCSANTKHGRQELLGLVGEMMDAIKAESGSNSGPQAAPKKRLDLQRPW